MPITEVARCRWCRLIFNSRDVHSGCPSTRLKTKRLADAADGWSSKVNRHARITRPSGRFMTTTRMTTATMPQFLGVQRPTSRCCCRCVATCCMAVWLGLAWPRSWPPDSATSSIVQAPNSQFPNPDLPPASLVPLETSETSPKKQNETCFVSFL